MKVTNHFLSFSVLFMISHHCSRTSTSSSSSRSRIAKLVVNAFSQQHYVKKNTFSFSTNTPRKKATTAAFTPFSTTSKGSTRNNIFGYSSMHYEQTKRWMSDGTTEKTDEEKEAIKAAREARK